MQTGASSCDSKKDPGLSLARGLLKNLLLVCAILVFGISGPHFATGDHPPQRRQSRQWTVTLGLDDQGQPRQARRFRLHTTATCDACTSRAWQHRSRWNAAVDVDPAQTPFLSWQWKVAQLPERGDFRHSATDDQAAQVLVAFADRRILIVYLGHERPQGLGAEFQFDSARPYLRGGLPVRRRGGEPLDRREAQYCGRLRAGFRQARPARQRCSPADQFAAHRQPSPRAISARSPSTAPPQ